MQLEIREYHTEDHIEEQVLLGIDEVVLPFLVEYNQNDNHDFKAENIKGIISDEDLKMAIYEEEGTVEVRFDEGLISRLMKHRGAHLLVAIASNELNSKKIGSPSILANQIVGFSIFFTDESDFPEEAESVNHLLSEFHPLCWLFYVVARKDLTLLKDMRNIAMRKLVERSIEIMLSKKCKYVVADYMIYPKICGAGLRMMLMSYFRHSGKRYGLGLKQPHERGEGNEHRTDIYELMIRDLDEAIIWKVHDCEKEKLKEILEKRRELKRKKPIS